jgi:hypothetical protein
MVFDAIFGVTLPAHRQFGICLVSPVLSRTAGRPVTASYRRRDDIDIERVELKATAEVS